MRRGKFFYVWLPFLLLIAYWVFVPSPKITKIEIQDGLGYVADGYDFRVLRLAPEGYIIDHAEDSFQIFDSTITNFKLNPDLKQAYVITNDGLVNIIDITNPATLQKIAYFDTPGFPQDVAISGQFAYIADGLAGIQIFGLQDLAHPIGIKTIPDLGFVSDIVQFGNLTFAARADQGVDIYDLTNLAEPKLIGHYDPGGIIGQISIEEATEEDGRKWTKGTLLVAQRAVQVVDFTDPQQPGLVTSYEFTDINIDKVVVRGRRIFASQGNKSILISRINDEEKLDYLAAINQTRAILDFAILEDTAFLARGTDGIQAYSISDLKNVRAIGAPYSNFMSFKLLIAGLCLLFLLLWLAFFAQFVLPVRTFRDRQKIFDRLIAHWLGTHGPAIFIENGRVRERPGERDKKGAGVAWLDTASAAVIRTATKFKEAIGPGVHFTEKHEYLAGPLDLHTQTETLGPKEKDKPFEEKAEGQGEAEYDEIQDRRTMTSALTRDGIEVVPNVTVVFRVDTKPVEGDKLPGSRFGYRTGTSEEEKAAEKEDKEAIYRAIAGEGIDPTVSDEMPRHRVAWNQLPGRLAVDVWREYVAKFTLDELFLQTQPPPLPELPGPESIDPNNQNPQDKEKATLQPQGSMITELLGEINRLLSEFADWLEGRVKEAGDIEENKNIPYEPDHIQMENGPQENQTALQVINEMVKKRLTQPETERLSDTGSRDPDEPVLIPSKEHELLQSRGLKILNVSISNLHFNKKVEEQIVSQWTANWYNNARAERERIERRQQYVELSGEEEAANEYIHTLSRHIMRLRPRNAKDTLHALLMRSKFVIARDIQLQSRMSTERQDIENILLWLENRQ